MERPPYLLQSAQTASGKDAHPSRTAESAPTESLTPDQQDLDHRLREWRKSESEKLGLPQFFVFGSSTLRSLVLTRPKTLAQLQTISGINPEKLDRYGAGILAVCNA